MLSQIRLDVPARSEQFAIINFSAVQSLAGCTRAEILTFNALALHADPSGHCWPGRERLANITQLSESRISKATSGLEKKGLIRKQQANGWRVDYYLLPQQALPLSEPLLISEPLPDLAQGGVQNGTGGCPKRHTEQHSEQTKEQREQAPEPARVEPQEPAPLSTRQLRSIKTPPPDEVPDQWLVIGKELRTDLDEALIRASAEKFLDDRRSKAIVLVDWIPAWKNWIRNERAPKAPTSPSKASKPESGANPYSTWEPGHKAPIGGAVDEDAAIKEFEKQALALGMVKGADDVWYRPTSPAIIKPVPIAKNEPYTPPKVPNLPKVESSLDGLGTLDAPRVENQPIEPPLSRRQQLERDFAVIGEAIARGATADELKQLEAELKRRREAALAGREAV